jgi:pyruvate dehydrogenase E1 component beta subunit
MTIDLPQRPALEPTTATIERPTMVQAINAALRDAMAADERVLVFGEDVGPLGGVFRITDGLTEQFGRRRCFDTPLAESGVIGVAIGLAIRGFRPVPEIQFDGFSYPAFEQLISHLAKYHNRSEGSVRMPVTVRIAAFGGIGAAEHHSESLETYLAHTAGLKVVSPAVPEDAYSMLREAIESDDPVIYLEPKRRYWTKGSVPIPAVTQPMDLAVVRRVGTDVTLVSYGPTVGVALEAAEAAEEQGWSVEVLDLRSLSPLDEEAIVASVERTRRCVVVHEAPRHVGLGAEVAARIQERAFFHLEAPVLRATGFDTPYPAARLESYWLPGVDRVLDLVERVLGY